MRKNLLTLSAVCLLLIASCSKGKEEPEQSKNEITINGTAYTTTVIGSQTWTTVNYNGNGGVNYNDGANDPKLGKLYSYTESKTLSNLPKGWRIPTEADALKLMRHLGSEMLDDGETEYLNAEKSKKLSSKTGWTVSANNGTNEIGLNMYPVGYYFPAWNGNPAEYTAKGGYSTFWLSTIDSHDNALFLELSYNNENPPVVQYPNVNPNLATSIGGTTLYMPNFSEKHPIRFVKDN